MKYSVSKKRLQVVVEITMLNGQRPGFRGNRFTVQPKKLYVLHLFCVILLCRVPYHLHWIDGVLGEISGIY